MIGDKLLPKRSHDKYQNIGIIKGIEYCARNGFGCLFVMRMSLRFQFDSRGRNYLHMVVLNNDVDGVLFLISIEVDVNSHIQDGSHRTPLHLAIPGGSETIVRHLVSFG